MKVTIEGEHIRIHGSRKVDLLIYFAEQKDKDYFSLSLAYDGFEHGNLPSIEVAGDHIMVRNNSLDKGVQLIK